MSEKTKVSIRKLNPFLLTTIALVAAGCVVLPTPAKHKLRGQETADASSVLKPGISTGEDIKAAFGPPTAIWEEARVWIYTWDESSSGWFWLFYGGLGGGDSGYERVWKKKITLLRFDGQGILVDASIEDRPQYKQIGQRIADWVYGVGTRPHLPPQKVPVLMRVVTSSGSESDKWGVGIMKFGHWTSYVFPKFGGFGTGGLVRENRRCEKIQKKYDRGGWVVFKLEPGFHYVTFELLNKMNEQPVFQFQVPAGKIPIYIGSFHFERDQLEKPSFWNMGSGTWTDYHFEGITDDRDLALQVVDEILPGYPGLVTHLAAIKPGPRIINSPHFRWLSGIYRSTSSEN